MDILTNIFAAAAIIILLSVSAALAIFLVVRFLAWMIDSIQNAREAGRLQRGWDAGFVVKWGVYTNDLAYHHGMIKREDIKSVGPVEVMDSHTGRRFHVDVPTPRQAEKNKRAALSYNRALWTR